MEFGGFQKLTLLNYPGKTACAVFTRDCNFRCPYCHNMSLILGNDPLIGERTVLEHLRKRKGLLEGICVSGGEPLLSDEILPFLEEVKKTGTMVKVDTNGSFPERLKQIIAEGLADYVAMDVKNTAEKYPETAGLSAVPFDNIRRSAEILKGCGILYEFRTTVVQEFHDAEDIRQIAEFLEGGRVWYLQSFREAPGVLRRDLHSPAPEKMREYGSIGNRFIKTMVRN